MTINRYATDTPARPLARVFVIDIDDVVADNTHRRAALPDAVRSGAACLTRAGMTREQIAEFMRPELLAQDAPIVTGCGWVRTVMTCRDMYRDHVVFCTGRWESLRAVTSAWLDTHVWDRHAPPRRRSPWWRLLMRRDDDMREAHAVKRELVTTHLDNLRARGYDVQPHVFVDDHRPTLDMARELGFVGLHAPACFDRITAYEVATTHPLVVQDHE